MTEKLLSLLTASADKKIDLIAKHIEKIEPLSPFSDDCVSYGAKGYWADFLDTSYKVYLFDSDSDEDKIRRAAEQILVRLIENGDAQLTIDFENKLKSKNDELEEYGKMKAATTDEKEYEKAVEKIKDIGSTIKKINSFLYEQKHL